MSDTSESWVTILSRSKESEEFPCRVTHDTSNAAVEYAKYWTSKGTGFPDARIEVIERKERLVAVYHAGW